MITTAQLTPYHRKKSDNFDAAESLKSKLAKLRETRRPFYLTKEELEEILRWKLRGQYGRQEIKRALNTDDLIQAVTGFALTVRHLDKEYELELRMNLLCVLRGIGVPVASAILALVYPDEYAVLDFRVWRQVFNEDKTTFLIGDYKKYMAEIRRLAQQLGWPVQQVDVAIWEYDRNHGN